MNHEYSVAIRTLGTSGEKYLALLESLDEQTIQPKNIFVYIPYGYEQPKETISKEKIIRCEKGMVAQRSLQFEEIDTEYILFCDDDMFLPPNLVKAMFDSLDKNKADCITPSCYPLHKMSFPMKLMVAIYNSSFPHNDKNWALKVKRDIGYTYNYQPRQDVLPTQTASGACFLCRSDVFHSIHFEDERWLDKLLFAALDDQLFHYKLYISGYKSLLYYNSGIIHLDARSAVRPDVTKKVFFKHKGLFIVWYRSRFSLKQNSTLERAMILLAYLLRIFIGLFPLLIDVLRTRKANYLLDYFRGIVAGYKFVHSKEYLQIPAFDAYIKL